MRLDWIDKAKGIGIILVIIGHTFFPPVIKFCLYSFHMPLFFFLSGYVFKIKTINFSDFLKNKINSLLLPAFIMELIIIIYSLIEGLIFNTDYSINFLEICLGIFIQRRGGTFSFGPWFLICLFTVQIMMYFILKYFKKDIQLLIIGVIFSILGYSYCTLIGFILPWAVEAALVAILFFIIGYLIKKNEDKFIKLFEFRYLFIHSFIYLGIIYLQIIENSVQLDMYINKYGNYIYFIISSFSGIFFIITLVKNVSLNKELNYIGRNSLIYYSLHGLILSTASLIIYRIFSNDFIESYYFYFGIINVFLCVILLHRITFLFNKYQILSINKKRLFLKNRTLVKEGG